MSFHSNFPDTSYSVDYQDMFFQGNSADSYFQPNSYQFSVTSYMYNEIPQYENSQYILPEEHQHQHPQQQQQPVKDEQFVPSSPQFIFEFPGGEEDPPNFDITATSAVFTPRDPSQVPTCDSPALDAGSCSTTSRTRPGSPTTEAMKAMMSVFRVDPFASYEADSGMRRKRRKRGSTYARTTDPEASSKEEPLMFTFQLDVGPPDWAQDEPDLELLSNEDHERSGGHGHPGHDLELASLPEELYEPDYAVFEDDATSPYRYRIHHAAPAFPTQDAGPAGMSRSSRQVTLSMPIPLQGTTTSPLFAAGEGSDCPEKYLPNLFPPVAVDSQLSMYVAAQGMSNSSQDASTTSPNTAALLTYSSSHSHSRQSSLTPSLPGAESDTYDDPGAQDLPASSVSLFLEGTTANSVNVPSAVALSGNNLTAGGRHARSRPPTKMHICWICHKEFPRPSGLATHMNTHSGAKPYKCPVPACSKTFAVRSNARRHLRIHGSLFESLVPFRAVSPDHDSGSQEGYGERQGDRDGDNYCDNDNGDEGDNDKGDEGDNDGDGDAPLGMDVDSCYAELIMTEGQGREEDRKRECFDRVRHGEGNGVDSHAHASYSHIDDTSAYSNVSAYSHAHVNANAHTPAYSHTHARDSTYTHAHTHVRSDFTRLDAAGPGPGAGCASPSAESTTSTAGSASASSEGAAQGFGNGRSEGGPQALLSERDAPFTFGSAMEGYVEAGEGGEDRGDGSGNGNGNGRCGTQVGGRQGDEGVPYAFHGMQFKGITGGGRVDTANMTINSLVATIGAY